MAKGKTPYTETIDWDSIGKELHELFNTTAEARKSKLTYYGTDHETIRDYSKIIVGAAQALAAASAEARAQREAQARKDPFIDKPTR